MRPLDSRNELAQALEQTLEQLFAPLARLAIERGLKFPQVKELLKRAFLQAARVADPGDGRRDVSRLATVAGLTRREVARLSQRQPPVQAARPSPATQVFTRWMAERKLRDSRGRLRVLARSGPAPSFDALARAVTRDVHPRRLLDELVRLGLVEHDQGRDVVRVLKGAFVPRDDQVRMLGFLGHNAGDHLSAAVANVLDDDRRHFEQALFADDLSDASIEIAKKLVNAQWRALTAALVPEIEELLKADRRAARRRDAPHANRRLRIGLYSYDEATAPDGAEEPSHDD
jgi:hypothetical protein